MRRLWRVMSAALNVVCGVLVLMCVVLHLFSHFYFFGFAWDNDAVVYFVGLEPYRANVGRIDDFADWPIGWHAYERIDEKADWGFALDEAWYGMWISIPIWFLALVFAVKPIWSFLAWRRRRNRTRNEQVCSNCGYDLRGNPDASACPECGGAVVK